MCGKDMGGIWVPGANDSKTYIPLKCNSHHLKFSKYPNQHSYYDVHSDTTIVVGEDPSLVVDHKGCIRSNRG